MIPSIRAMADKDLWNAIELFRRTNTLPEHRAALEAELCRRQKLRRGKEVA